MKSFKTIILGICIVFTLAACDQAVWYDTREEAIKKGLQGEGISASSPMSVEEYDDETIVSYAQDNSLGVASITESEKGYSWYRSAPYHGFEVTGDLPYTTGSFTFETEAGVEVTVLYGEIFDPTMQVNEVASREGLNEVTLLGESNLFYTFLE
ncbi:hypothetical protein KQ939_08970 [Planococcus sp. CP5-4]|uniref:hypothetical protein n=1 Tax=unclassified Planococcus (in: firmicutes) TaxID=2662419 RepID=UPI001C21E5EF|nr:MULTISPECIES: hypothetical protein [unclassified Planococcus (in: firmicutes)]MBU9675031.1 hypothetical protein [Planococcus sp. CP5-4_YE]MBV0910381.1 hypothetical protein [Planococcus sp. CP5-4_UN]MBW6063843.1 hypothetical protein [Planococcus sp. CP5-4]